MTGEQLVTMRTEGSVAYVTFNRPDANNLVTHDMMLALIDALAATGQADVLVISGTGNDFCLGRDQSEHVAGASPEQRLSHILECNRLLDGFPGVSVAVVRGRALGFGSGLVLHCDIAIAAESAAFGFDEIKHGFPPLIVQSYLTRYVPLKPALDLVLTGDTIPAARALQLGIVSRTVVDGELDACAAELVSGLAEANGSALRHAKRFAYAIDDIPREERADFGLRALVDWRKSG